MGTWSLQLRRDGILLAHDDAEALFDGKPAALLAYLAVEGPTSRRTLSALLWPDSDASRARANLRKLLSRMGGWREAIQGDDPISLRPELDPPAWHPLPERFGFDAAAPFESWLLQTRERRLRERIQWLRREIDRLEESGEASSALRSTRELLALDPSEATARAALALAGRLGHSHAGLELYRGHRARIEREFGATPDPATEALAHDLARAGDGDALAVLASEAARLHGAEGSDALERLDASRSAWLAAWRSAVRDGDAEALGTAADALSDYFELRGEVHLAVSLLSQAHLALEPVATMSERRAAARLLIHLAWHQQRLGLATAGAHAERGLRLLPPDDETTYRARGLYALGLALWSQGDATAARRHWDLAHEALGGARDVRRSALLHGNVGIAADALGETDRARRHYRAAIEGFEARNEAHATTPYLNNLGQLLVESQHVRDGVRLLERGIDLARSHGQRTTLAYLLDSRCRAALAEGRLDVARSALDEAEELARACSDRVLSTALLANEARLAIAGEAQKLDASEALRKALTALRAAHDLHVRPALFDAMLVLADTLHAVGATDECDRILATIAAQGGVPGKHAQQRLADREARPAKDLDGLVAALLELSQSPR